MTMLLMMPSLPSIGAGSAPPGSPAPGTPGGGGLPNIQANPSASQAVSLVPFGLTPVAVFPPFDTPRTLPAIAVIFSEAPTRRKRDAYDYHHSSSESMFSRVWRKVSTSPFAMLWSGISPCEYYYR